MTAEHDVSIELLNAFVDDELSAAEKSQVLERIAEDPQLRERVCELWQLKEMTRSAYPLRKAPQAPRRSSAAPALPRFAQALAAGVILLLGIVGGWFGHGERDASRGLGFQLAARQVDEGKIILHVASGGAERFKAALDEAEQLSLSRDKAGHPLQVELIANGSGLDLLRADASPYADRIRSLREAHANLRFLACNLAIENLRGKGVEVRLLPQAAVAPSALDQIMKRLRQGWLYIQV
jgi:uncharacterized protein